MSQPQEGLGKAAPGLNQASLAALGKYGGRRGQQALALVAAVQVLAPAAKWAAARVKKHEDFTITVGGTDDIYADLHEWVLARIPQDERKALIATTDREMKFVAMDSNEPAPQPRVRLRYDGSRTQSVEIDGHKVEVEVKREEIPGGRDRLPENWRQLTENIKFTAASAGGRDAIAGMLDGLLQARSAETGPPPLLVPSRWGGSWNRRNDLPQRTLESIILKRGQLERLVADLEAFLEAEGEYARVHQPWHRGYLFHGAPGTGKTSVARALANHFEMPVYYLPLGDLDRDADLMALVGAIEGRSILLLEDVDVYRAATERTDEKDTTSVAALLNALDGVWTPHGLVTIMTTNERDHLDPALIRAGRVDVDEEFTTLDGEQAERLSTWITGDDTGCARVGREFNGQSPAALIGALRDMTKQEVGDETATRRAADVRADLECHSPNGASSGAVAGLPKRGEKRDR